MEAALQTDNPWKELLDEFFPDFFALFLPDVYAEIDWDKGFRVLDKEFQKLEHGKKQNQFTVDKLLEVHQANGENVLVHVRISDKKQEDFAFSMSVYHARIYNRFQQPIMSLALLTDADPTWRPNRFEFSLGESSMEFEFPIVKLVDYKGKWAQLSDSQNLFGIAVLAHLKAMETEKDEDMRFEWKLAFMQGLNPRASGRKIERLMEFIDWIFKLSDRLEDQFRKKLKEQGGDLMPYITSFERSARREGRKEGLEQGLEQGRLNMARESVLEALEARFGVVPDGVGAALEQISSAVQCKSLLQHAILEESMKTFERKLQALIAADNSKSK